MTTWGSTEAGDPVFDDSWTRKLQDVNVIITKALTDDLMDKLLQHQKCCILHLTVTGLGGSFQEPCVPRADWNATQLSRLLNRGFPVSQAVLRIDPMLSASIGQAVLDEFAETGVRRVRFSFLNLTNYTENKADEDMLKSEAIKLTDYAKEKYPFYTFESCAGTFLKDVNNIKLCGCMSREEAAALVGDVEFDFTKKRNRHACFAPGNRVELLEGKKCEHNCKYCFWSAKK